MSLLASHRSSRTVVEGELGSSKKRKDPVDWRFVAIDSNSKVSGGVPSRGGRRRDLKDSSGCVSARVKGRCMLPGCKRGQRLGSIDIDKEFDAVLMVLVDENFDALEIYEADRAPVIAALTAPGSKARNERGALGVNTSRELGV